MPDAQGNPLPGEPGYVEPTEAPTTQGGALGIPPLELSDQSDTMDQTRENLGEITEEAKTALGGIEHGDVEYDPVDAERLKEESALGRGEDYMTPESTVAEQLNKLLESDSKYMQTAERRAQEKAASLGLLGSSMAVGASQRAAIESALPIAQQDASTYAKFQLAEQATSNEMSRMKSESDLSAYAREHVYQIDAEKQKFAAQVDIIAQQAKSMGNAEVEMGLKKALSTWDAETKEHLARIDAELTMRLQSQEIDAREREYSSTTSSQIMAAAYGTINDLMGNADFMAGYADNAEGLQSVFNNFINLAKDQVRFIGASAGLTEEYMDPDSGYLELIGEWALTPAPSPVEEEEPVEEP